MKNWTREGREGRPPIYWYHGVPSTIDLEGIPVKQKGKTFYVISAAASELDRLCTVPVVPYSTPNSDVATDATTHYISRWQRELDPSRSIEIARFFADPGNLIVNAAVIGLPRSATFFVGSSGRAVCRIPVSWPTRRCPLCNWTSPTEHPHSRDLFDACPDPECSWEGRPGRLIDGQHRIRGCAASPPPRCDEPLVTTVLVEDQFNTSDEAKIFTEITTSAVDLDPLHKFFLLYKFGLRGFVGDKDADFRPSPPSPGAANTLGLRNRRAYEIACDLVRSNESRWFDRISMFPGPTGHSRRGDLVEVDVLVEFLESWLASGPLTDPTQSDGMAPTGLAAAWMRDYLEATLAVWPSGGGTPPGASTTFWFEGRGKQGVLQMRGIFEVFLSLFSTITRRLLSHGIEPDKTRYLDELRFIEKINWDDSGWTDLAAPDMNKDLLRRVLDHLYAQAPFPVGAARVSDDVNDWMHRPPDHVTFTEVPPKTSPFATASLASPLTFSWCSRSPFASGAVPKPVNAYIEADLLFVQNKADGKPNTLGRVRTKKTKWVIDSPPAGLDAAPGANPVQVLVIYKNRVGETTDSFTQSAV